MEEVIIQVVGQVMVYDGRQWHPAGTCGLSSVRLLENVANNTFKITGHKINDTNEVVLNNEIVRGIRFNKTTDTFIQWHDNYNTEASSFWGLNFRKNTPDADNFYDKVVQIMNILNRSPAQQPAPQQQRYQSVMTNDMVHQGHQQVQRQQSSAAIMQRTIQQQVTQPLPQAQQQQQPAPQVYPNMQHILTQQQQQQQQQQPQQQPHENQQLQQHQAAQAMLSQAPPIQLIQQQQKQQQLNQPLLQQQMHQHYMQQQQQPPQPQAQSHTNQNNHYQQANQQAQIKQQDSSHHLQQAPQQVQHAQTAAPSSAPIPPPPPPPPPAPPAGVINTTRVNGVGSNPGSQINNEAQHSPITANNHAMADSNGGSPSQTSSLANELAKCQLKKVNLSRSDSDKESECNNNIVGNPKTTRAASLAHVPVTSLMSEMSKKLASRRERLDQQDDNRTGGHSNSSNTNGTGNDKSHDDWLANLIRKEIAKEMSKLKIEIIDAIKSELKQR